MKFTKKDEELKPDLVMTIKQVADSLNVSRDLIEKRVKELYPNMMKKGVTTYLTESQVTAVKLRIQDNSSLATSDDRRKLIDMPKTELEKKLLIKQAMGFLIEEVEQLRIENEELKPKAELADLALRDKTVQYSITNAGKHIGYSQTEMYITLREKGFLTTKNLPSQRALNMGILELKTTPVNGVNRPQPVMTMENIDNFRKYLDGARNVKKIGVINERD